MRNTQTTPDQKSSETLKIYSREKIFPLDISVNTEIKPSTSANLDFQQFDKKLAFNLEKRSYC